MTLDLARSWWLVVLRGALAVAFGVIALFWPGAALGALVLLFGAYALTDGAFAVVSAFRAAGRGMRWWPFALEGVIGVLAGLAALLFPGGAALALVTLLAVWAIMTGVLEIVAAVRLRREIENEWLLGLAGVLSLAFGVIVLFMPAAGAVAIAWTVGAYALLFGISLIVLGFRLRTHRPAADMADVPDNVVAMERSESMRDRDRPTSRAA